MIGAHIGGVPLEEALLGFGPVAVAAAGVWLVRLRELRSRVRRRRTAASKGT